MCANAQRYKYTGERSCLFQIQEQSRVPKTKLQFFFKLHFFFVEIENGTFFLHRQQLTRIKIERESQGGVTNSQIT